MSSSSSKNHHHIKTQAGQKLRALCYVHPLLAPQSKARLTNARTTMMLRIPLHCLAAAAAAEDDKAAAHSAGDCKYCCSRSSERIQTKCGMRES